MNINEINQLYEIQHSLNHKIDKALTQIKHNYKQLIEEIGYKYNYNIEISFHHHLVICKIRTGNNPIEYVFKIERQDYTILAAQVPFIKTRQYHPLQTVQNLLSPNILSMFKEITKVLSLPWINDD